MPSIFSILFVLFILPHYTFDAHLEPEPDSAGEDFSAPLTIFLPYDKPLLTLHGGSVAGLREHVVPGLFPLSSLTKIGAFPNKLETAAPGRCLTVTATASNIFVNSVEIIQPEIVNDGLFILHGISDFLPPLETTSCDPDPMQLEAFKRLGSHKLLDPAMGFEIPELPPELENMTVFAVEDERGHSLVVTRAVLAGGPIEPGIMAADGVYGDRIVLGVYSKIRHLVSEVAPARTPSGESSSGGVAAPPSLSPTVDLHDDDL